MQPQPEQSGPSPIAAATQPPPFLSPPTSPPPRRARGLIIGLSVGLVGVVLVVFVTFFLLYTRTASGVGATWGITIAGTHTTDGGPVAATALQPGDTYLAIDLTVKNVTSRSLDFAGYIDFTVKDAAGQTYHTTYLPGPDPIDGPIPGGASKSGTIAFEVPASQHTFTLIYADPTYGTQHWTVTV